MFFAQGQGHNRKVKQTDNLCPVQDSGSLAVFKVTARDQGHYKGPSGAFVTYCNISCFSLKFNCHIDDQFTSLSRSC